MRKKLKYEAPDRSSSEGGRSGANVVVEEDDKKDDKSVGVDDVPTSSSGRKRSAKGSGFGSLGVVSGVSRRLKDWSMEEGYPKGYMGETPGVLGDE